MGSPVQERKTYLQGQLAESHKVEEKIGTELEAARLQRFAAEKEKVKAEAEMIRAEERCFKANDEMERFRKDAEEAKRQLNELEVCELLDS